MGLTNDLISQFAKITKDTKKSSKESTVFGTAVEYNGSMYVRIDGSDLLTPAITTANTKSGERVTVLIKNHSATITGNITSPSCNDSEVNDAVSRVDDVSSKISEFEIIIADKVSSSDFDAQVGRIDTLYSDTVTIKQSLATNEATIKDLKAEHVTINKRLTANEASIDNLETTKLDAEVATITYATIEDLTVTNADIYNLRSTYADFEVATSNRLSAIDATINNLDATYATITDLNTERARIDVLEAGSLSADSALIKQLQAGIADIDTLIFGSASGNVIQTSFANAVIAQLGAAQIKSAMIDSVSADKITVGDIITNNVRVMSEDGKLLISDETIQISDETRVRVQIGKDAANDYSINIWDADGNLMFSKGGITDKAIKSAIIRDDMVSDTADISAHKLNIDSLFEVINGSTSTIKSSRIYFDDAKQSLDIAFNTVITDLEDLENTVNSHGTQLSVIQGQITSKVWQQDIDTVVDDVNTLKTQYSTLNQTVTSMSATVSDHTSKIENKADKSSVTSVSDKVSEVELGLTTFKTTVSETYATKGEVTGVTKQISTNKTAIEQNTSEIALRAKKTEVENAISNIDVGGRNLLLDTESIIAIPETDDLVSYSKQKTYKFSPIITNNAKDFLLKLKERGSLALSFDVNLPRVCKDSSLSLSRLGAYMLFKFVFTDGGSGYWYGTHTPESINTNRHTLTAIGVNSLIALGSAETSFVGRYSGYVVPFESTSAILQKFYNDPDSCIVTAVGLTVEFGGFTTGGSLSNFKMELGNKSTDWTPAPEDLETKVETAEANISLNTDSISGLVTRTTENERSISELKQTSTSLTSRISTAESDIESNAALATDAKNTADDARTAAANAQSDIDDLEIGGRNLARNTSEPVTYTFTTATGTDSYNKCVRYYSHGILLEAGQTYTLSYDYEFDWGSVSKPTDITQIGAGIGSDNGSGSPGSYTADTFSTLANYWTYGSGKYDSGKFVYSFTNNKTVDLYFAFRMLRTYSGIGIDLTGVTLSISNFKVEKGNRATDWSPAPEDMATSDELDSVQSTAEITDERLTIAETLIEQLSDCISMLVVDSNGESLMTQTDEGWTFSTSKIQSAVESASENLNELENVIGDVNSTIDVIQQALSDLGVLNDYVKIGSYESEPCIELGESDSEFKLIITNTRITFAEGSGIPAYFSNQSMFIKRAVIEEELEQGEFVWKARSNGNLGLIWKGGSS